jgi:hypothetical protein
MRGFLILFQIGPVGKDGFSSAPNKEVKLYIFGIFGINAGAFMTG